MKTMQAGWAEAALARHMVLPSRLLWPAAVLLLCVVALLPATPVLYHTPDTDNSIFLFIGQKITQGDLPYRDWYDHKPPLIFYLNALGLALGGGSRWGVWAIELVMLSAAGLSGFAFLRRYFGAPVAFLAMAATLLNLAFVHQRGNMTEEYALPFQFAALFILGGLENSRRPMWRLLAIGAMFGMASTLKQPMAGAGLATAVYLFVVYTGQRRWAALIKAYLGLGLGALAVWAVWFVYFYLAGIFPEFWEAAFQYNFALSGIPLERRIRALLSAFKLLVGWSHYFTAGMLAWLAALPFLALNDERIWLGLKAPTWLAKRQAAGRTALFLPLLVAVVDLPVEILLSSLSGNNFAHYFMALLPSLAVLLAFLIYSLWRLFDPAMGQPLPAIWLLLLLIPVFWPGIYETLDRIGPRGDRQIEQLAAYIEANTGPDDFVYQWGIIPSVHLLTGRDSPTRFFFPDPLFVDGYSGRAQTELFLRDLQANPPVLVIDEGIQRLPLLAAPDPARCETVKDPRVYEEFVAYWKDKVEYTLPQMPEGMDEVYEWICQNYEPAGRVGELGRLVYRLRGSE